MASLGQIIKEHWLYQKLALQPGATEAELQAFEDQYRVRLPADVRGYFSAVNGMAEDCAGDALLINFWPLPELKRVTEAAPFCHIEAAESYFIFADFLIWSHAYAIRLSSDLRQPNPVIIVHGAPIQLADSFTEFMQEYLRHNEAVLFPRSS